MVFSCINIFGFLCIVTLTEIIVFAADDLFAAKRCTELKNNCTRKVECGMALQNYYLGCHNLIYGNGSTCEISCERALIALLSTDEGQGRWFANCSCAGDPYCEEQRQKLDVCSHSVLGALNATQDSPVVRCSLARTLCEADAPCHTAFYLYMSQCDATQEGHECTHECRNSLDVLYRQRRAVKLKNCTCDNEVKYKDCVKIHKTTDKRCMNRNTPYRIIHSSDSASNASSKQLLFNCVMIFVFAYTSF